MVQVVAGARLQAYRFRFRVSQCLEWQLIGNSIMVTVAIIMS